MDLKTYIQSTRGNGESLAKKLGIPPSYLSQMASGNRAITPERAAAFERETGGVVTVEETLPQKSWVRVPDKSWPNANGRPLSDVAAEPIVSAVEAKAGA